jgi:hypothetical protein
MNVINLGYGSVEFCSKTGYNIVTKKKPLESKKGLKFKEPSSVVAKNKALMFVQSFLDTILFESCYVVPEKVSMRGRFPDVVFSISDKFLLHILVIEDEIYPVLLFDNDGDLLPLKFEYKGEELRKFFSEIKIAVKNFI